MKKKGSEGRRAFLCSLGVTLSLLILGAGIVTVDYQGRRLSFGDADPPVAVLDKPGGGAELEIKLLGMEKQVDITELDEFWDFLRDFGCIPHK